MVEEIPINDDAEELVQWIMNDEGLYNMFMNINTVFKGFDGVLFIEFYGLCQAAAAVASKVGTRFNFNEQALCDAVDMLLDMKDQ